MADNEVTMRLSLPEIRRKVAAFLSPARVTQDVEIADLLGRAPVNLDTPELQRFIGSKRVLITGAGGSIGSEIARQAAKFCPSQLILLDRFENALFEIDRELRSSYIGLDLIPFVADVCDVVRVAQVFKQYHPQVVFHAAAHKHVPMMEANPGEAVKNNVFGTRNVADAAARAACNAFVLISTDKAVNPTSVMGATKRCAELYVQSLNGGEDTADTAQRGASGNTVWPAARKNATPTTGTRFLAVRFGNVLGSNGSVVPIFKKQIAQGGPVTVTHPDMRRYFMTIPEASQLVMQAGAIGKGGEIFVLDMGEPIRILELAREMIRRSGFGPDEIPIEFSGIRPGEKLFEELACDNEQTQPTSHQKIRVWKLEQATREQARAMLERLQKVIDSPRAKVVEALCDIVPEYASESRPPRLKLAGADRVKDAA